MAVSFSYQVQSSEFNSTTYNNATGGVKRFQYAIRGEPLRDWVGSDEFNSFLAVVNKICWVRLTIREVKFTVAIGTKDTSCATILQLKSASTVTLTFVNMILYGTEGDQPDNENGSNVLDFGHESADGTAYPLS